MTAHSWGYLADDSVAASIIDDALSAADGHAEFADVRLIEAEEMRLYTQLGADSDERLEHNMGIGVRVLVDGTWGFAARPLQDSHDAVKRDPTGLGHGQSIGGDQRTGAPGTDVRSQWPVRNRSRDRPVLGERHDQAAAAVRRPFQRNASA